MHSFKICPFCKKENFCDVNSFDNCWCNKIDIPKQLLQLVPKNLEVKSCVCKKCILSFTKDSEKFIKRYDLTK